MKDRVGTRVGWKRDTNIPETLRNERLAHDGKGIMEADSGTHRISVPSRLRAVFTAGTMTVYRRPKATGQKPFVVGFERDDKLILLEEFALLKDAKQWATDNKDEG